MKRTIGGALFAVTLIVGFAGCEQDSETETGTRLLNVIPAPLHVVHLDGRPAALSGDRIVIPSEAGNLPLQWLLQWIVEQGGPTLTVDSGSSDEAPAVLVELVTSDTLLAARAGAAKERNTAPPPGAYRLTIRAGQARVSAADEAGVFYGLVTLAQILSDTTAPANLDIYDEPRFQWRGLMLDSARHYQTPEQIRTFIDWMALHKLNVLHWHLTDDQGWRLQIDAYPKLTEVGAWRVPAGAAKTDIDPATGQPRLSGGFYSHADVRELVQYAADRQVTIVPEVDVPGHVTAALAAYPELGVEGVRVDSVPADWGIYHNVLNLEPATLEFVDAVFAELIDLFPSRYIHIGGDEVVRRQWAESERVRERMAELGIANVDEIQNFFTRHLDSFLREQGRVLVGWDEILDGELPPDAVVMSWRGVNGAVEAAQRGHRSILSPAPDLYLDHVQTAAADAPPGRGGVISVQDVYNFDPLPDGVMDSADIVLGIQANLWTEHVRTPERVEYMTWPRAAALAERAWLGESLREWPEFSRRLARQWQRFRRAGVQASDDAFAVRIDAKPIAGNRARVALAAAAVPGEIHYTTDGSEPNAGSPRYAGPVDIDLPFEIAAVQLVDGRPVADTRRLRRDERTLMRREDRELLLCSERIALALEDDTPLAGPRESYLLDIMDPCWIYKDLPSERLSGIQVAVGQVPFNFQIGADIDAIPLDPAAPAAGEIEIRAGDCNAEVLARLGLERALAGDGTPSLLEIPLTLHKQSGPIDLCVRFRRRSVDPIWTLDWIQPVLSTPAAGRQ